MNRNTGIFILSLLILFACSRDENNNKKGKGIRKTSIFNLNTLLTDEENDVSFPLWFNDSIIRKHKIKKIIRKTYSLDRGIEDPMKEIKGMTPRELREYFFGNDGSILKMNIHYFYDDREIGSVLFSYSGQKDGFGFSQVAQKTIVNKTEKRISETHEYYDPEVRELYFRMHVKRKGSKKYLAYQDMETGDFVYYMMNSKYWGVLAVDSILEPTPKDQINWGTPKFPSKKYQVANKVNESNVKEFIYDKEDPNVPAYWIKHNYPFDYKRTFSYNAKGVCNGYVDSTFADEIYVTRMISTIYLNRKNEPVRILHQKQNATNEKHYYSLETYEYQK